jgi:WD40 repeat protein
MILQLHYGYTNLIKNKDLINFTHLASLVGHKEGIKDMIIIEETGHLVSCAYDGKINIWDYPQAKLIHVFIKKYNFLDIRKK